MFITSLDTHTLSLEYNILTMYVLYIQWVPTLPTIYRLGLGHSVSVVERPTLIPMEKYFRPIQPPRRRFG